MPHPHLTRDEAISIHALREEGDGQTASCNRNQTHFYPRPPRGGRRCSVTTTKTVNRFLSTPSARRATQDDDGNGTLRGISIHALREEGDQCGICVAGNSAGFLSTPSARRATCRLVLALRSTFISIHALREEGDSNTGVVYDSVHNFYPRPPRGGRPPRSAIKRCKSRFLSTPSARRATVSLLTLPDTRCDFYPRPPRGGRPASVGHSAAVLRFLSTPSARRATCR